jgi:hypothetical protein
LIKNPQELVRRPEDILSIKENQGKRNGVPDSGTPFENLVLTRALDRAGRPSGSYNHGCAAGKASQKQVQTGAAAFWCVYPFLVLVAPTIVAPTVGAVHKHSHTARDRRRLGALCETSWHEAQKS